MVDITLLMAPRLPGFGFGARRLRFRVLRRAQVEGLVQRVLVQRPAHHDDPGRAALRGLPLGARQHLVQLVHRLMGAWWGGGGGVVDGG